MNIKDKIKRLPEKPGVYEFLDATGTIIYIGKAINLKKRVNSYFVKNKSIFKISILVKNIVDVNYIVVDNETDALLLENNLIKEYQPKYNVQLKDDKTYPWICIKNEPFPRIFATRNKIKDGSEYFGPYTSAVMIRTLLQLIRQLYPLRTCKYNLTKENILAGKFKVCLEYHIGNCKGPCISSQTEIDYEQSIEQIRKIIKGNIRDVISYLKQLMDQYSSEFKYEQANVVKEKIELLEKYRSKSTIVSTTIKNLDVFSIIDSDKYAIVNYLGIIDGAIIQSHTIEVIKKLEETKENILEFVITEIVNQFESSTKEIVVPFAINLPSDFRTVHVPQRGDKRKLLQLSERNARFFELDKQKRNEQIKNVSSEIRKLETLKKDLNLSVLPRHIECFDNSNIQGTNPVAACVVFKNTRPFKSEYRHYNIKTVEGPDDFASMKEIVFRRYKRLLDEKRPLPDLIVIDGGKGQLKAAAQSLQVLNLFDTIPIIGIAKRLEEIYFPNDTIPIYLDKNTESLKVIQHIRNEAHRFGISFHRNKRSLDFTRSELDNINGIGEQTKNKLFSNFNSMDEIRCAKIIDLQLVIGERKAKIVWDYFNG